MQQFAGTSLKTRLYLLVLVAFIPISGLIFYIAEEKKSEETEAIFQKTLVLTRAAAVEENQNLELTRSLLAAVADVYLILQDRPGSLSLLMANLSGQSEGYVRLGILGVDGRLVVGGDPSATGGDYSDRTWFSECLQKNELAIGQYRGESIDGEPVLYFALPVHDTRGKTAAVAFAALDLNWMNRSIFKSLETLPEGYQLTVLDGDNGIIRYDTQSGKWSVPKNFPPALKQQIFERQSGTLNVQDEKDGAWIYAFSPLYSSFREHHVSMVLGVPEALALSASNRNFIRNVALLILSAALAVLIIWWAGDFYILRRIRKIVRVSRELAGGDLDARVGNIGGHDEMGHLAGVFDEMASSLQARIDNEELVMASLESSRQQLRNLAAYQQEVRESERLRIAREIHDQFGQSLTILKMDLSWLKKKLPKEFAGVDEKLKGMDQVIDDSLETIHTIMAELRPVILDDFGLSAAIEWQVEEFRNRSGIDCRMERTGYEPALPKDQSTAVFRIFQEILTNILRHANAGKVEVGLREAEGRLILEVQDDGRGITEAEINDSASYGLIGIRERLYPWHGRVSFEGRAGMGTRVTVILPLAPKGDTP